MTRRTDPLDAWPVVRQAEPWRWTWRDDLIELGKLLAQVVAVLLIFAAVLIGVLWMGAVIEAVPA